MQHRSVREFLSYKLLSGRTPCFAARLERVDLCRGSGKLALRDFYCIFERCQPLGCRTRKRIFVDRGKHVGIYKIRAVGLLLGHTFDGFHSFPLVLGFIPCNMMHVPDTRFHAARVYNMISREESAHHAVATPV